MKRNTSSGVRDGRSAIGSGKPKQHALSRTRMPILGTRVKTKVLMDNASAHKLRGVSSMNGLPGPETPKSVISKRERHRKRRQNASLETRKSWILKRERHQKRRQNVSLETPKLMILKRETPKSSISKRESPREARQNASQENPKSSIL